MQIKNNQNIIQIQARPTRDVYDKEIILDYLVKNNVTIHECKQPKIFSGIGTGKISRIFESNEIEVIDNKQYLFISHEFHFGGNNIDVAKELLSIASRQNNTLPIEFTITNGYIECSIGEHIYNVVQHYIN